MVMLEVRSELSINGAVVKVTDHGSVGTAAFLGPLRQAARETSSARGGKDHCVPEEAMAKNFTLKGIIETFHDIESTNDEMGETNLNIKEYGICHGVCYLAKNDKHCLNCS